MITRANSFCDRIASIYKKKFTTFSIKEHNRECFISSVVNHCFGKWDASRHWVQIEEQLRGDGQANWVDGLRMGLGTEGGNVTMTALSWQLFRDRDKDEEDN